MTTRNQKPETLDLGAGLWWKRKSDKARPTGFGNEAETETGERQDAERHHQADRGGADPFSYTINLSMYYVFLVRLISQSAQDRCLALWCLALSEKPGQREAKR